MTGETSLVVENLTVGVPESAGGFRAVRDASFSVPRGSTVCLVGESGSGKSMTARAVLRLVPEPLKILDGRILLGPEGEDIAAVPEKSSLLRELRGGRIGMIFQEPMSALGPVHRIGAQIMEAVLAHRPVGTAAARARAVELLRQVDIPDPESAVDRYPFEFSGGMRQRAMIAIALACEPELLVADEPTTALDVTTQADILALLARLRRENGMSVLFITHDMGVVAEIADHVVVMREGKVVERGTARGLFGHPAHSHTRNLLEMARKLAVDAPAPSRREFSESGGPMLSVRNLSVKYGGERPWFGKPSAEVRAVRAVSFDLREGESLGVVGESGSGKTSLARALLRIEKPVAGTAHYRLRDGDAVDLARLAESEIRHLRREIRMIFQDPFASLNPRMTIGDSIAEPLLVGGVGRRRARERAAELLQKVGLSPAMMARYPHAFSGGQRQRICIARALAPEPRLIVADEATAALDASLRAQILDLMRELQKEMGLAFLFIGHDIGVVRYFCDRVGVMRRGEMVEIGGVDAVCDRPTHPYTRALLSAVPRPDPNIRRKEALQ